MDIIFEEMKEEYLKEVLSIYNYYVTNTTVTFNMHILNEDEMREIIFFDNHKYKSYIIKWQDTIIGYVTFSQYKKREAYDNTGEIGIYLKQDYIGKGIGKEALCFIEEIAYKQNVHVLISSICSENYGSVSLFEKNGYNKCGHYREVGKKFGRWLDVVVYQKILSE